jgi:hypothetical protein
MRSRSKANGFAGHHDRAGLRGPCDLYMPVAPFPRGQESLVPSRTFDLLRRSTSRPCNALRRSLDEAPRCLEPLLQPTFRVTSTRDENTTFGDSPPGAVGKPAVARLRGSSSGRSVAAVRPLDYTGPPCGHPASNGPVLDGTTPASGRSTATFAPERGWGRERRRFFSGR